MYDYNAFIEFAEKTYQDVDPAAAGAETLYRIAVSRAYYGAFKLAYKYLHEVENDPIIMYDYSKTLEREPSIYRNTAKKLESEAKRAYGDAEQLRDDHKEYRRHVHLDVRKMFECSGKNPRSAIADALSSLVKLRLHADYDEVPRVLKHNLKTALSHATTVRTNLQKLAAP